jgi:hypothetical protein
MKHAITGPKGRIFNVLDEPNDRTTPITNAQATLVASKVDPMGYWIIEGSFKTGEEVRVIRQAEREAERIAAMTPEQLAARQLQAHLQAVHDAAAQAFESLPLGKQILWENTRVQVQAKILKGEIAKVREILETIPSLYEDMEADREIFLDLLATFE